MYVGPGRQHSKFMPFSSMPKLLLSAENFCVTYAHVLSFTAWPGMHHWFGFSPVSAAHIHSQARYMPSPAMTAPQASGALSLLYPATSMIVTLPTTLLDVGFPHHTR